MDILDETVPEHVRNYAARTKEVLELKEKYTAALRAKEAEIKVLEPQVMEYLKSHGKVSCPSGTQFGPPGTIQLKSFDRKKKMSTGVQVELMTAFFKLHLTATESELRDFSNACLDYVDKNRGRDHQESLYRYVQRPRKKRKRDDDPRAAVDLMQDP